MLSECLKESGLKLPESDVREMADALYEEAIGEVNKLKNIQYIKISAKNIKLGLMSGS